jgi:hypothetical protein
VASWVKLKILDQLGAAMCAIPPQEVSGTYQGPINEHMESELRDMLKDTFGHTANSTGFVRHDTREWTARWPLNNPTKYKFMYLTPLP